MLNEKNIKDIQEIGADNAYWVLNEYDSVEKIEDGSYNYNSLDTTEIVEYLRENKLDIDIEEAKSYFVEGWNNFVDGLEG